MTNPAGAMLKELVLGGQRSGKSRRAESLAVQWMAQSAAHRAVLIATALPSDPEMVERIARHQADRRVRAPGLDTLEEPRDLAQAIAQHSQPHQMVVVDCLTVWLSHWALDADADVGRAPVQALVGAVAAAPGPVVLVSNEIGMGVIPMGEGVRAYVDVLGRMHQQLGQVCTHLTLMVAGQPLRVKGSP